MGVREHAVGALLTRISAAYAWATPPGRRLKLWSDVPLASRPACFLFEGGTETYADTATDPAKRTLSLRLFIYIDAYDPETIGATRLNDIMDALDAALAPVGSDLPLGRCTLGGTAYRCAIDGKPLKDPGDFDGDGLLLVPIIIVLP